MNHYNLVSYSTLSFTILYIVVERFSERLDYLRTRVCLRSVMYLPPHGSPPYPRPFYRAHTAPPGPCPLCFASVRGIPVGPPTYPRPWPPASMPPIMHSGPFPLTFHHSWSCPPHPEPSQTSAYHEWWYHYPIEQRPHRENIDDYHSSRSETVMQLRENGHYRGKPPHYRNPRYPDAHVMNKKSKGKQSKAASHVDIIIQPERTYERPYYPRQHYEV